MSRCHVPAPLKAAVVLWGVVVGAYAGPSDPFVTIETSNTNGTAVLNVPLSSATFNTFTQQWMYSSGTMVMSNGARLNSLFVIMTEDKVFTTEVDAQVFLVFDVTSDGLSETTFHIVTGSLAFPPIASAIGDFSGAINVGDGANNDGVTLTGNGASGKAVSALYNGGIPFVELVSSVTAGPSLTNNSGPLDTIAPIGTTVSDIRVDLDFRLTPGDNASGQADFVIIPEPAAALVLLVFGVATAARRRAA